MSQPDSMQPSVIAVFSTLDDAEAAIQALGNGGFPVTQVSIVAKDLQSERKVCGFVTAGDVAKVGAGSGAWAGGLFGVLTGAAFLFVPGAGPMLVAGPAAATLLAGVEGTVAGAAGGGIVGRLVGIGVAKQHVIKYEAMVKAGKYLVIAHGTPADGAKARAILTSAAGAMEVADAGQLVPA